MLRYLVTVTLALLVAGAVFTVVERRWPALRGSRRLEAPGPGHRPRLLVRQPFRHPDDDQGRHGRRRGPRGPRPRGAPRGREAPAVDRGAPHGGLAPATVAPGGGGADPRRSRSGTGRHRLFHRRPLWRFHAVHHAARELDWLSSVRVHPVNEALMRVAYVVPLFALGFRGEVLAGVTPLFTLYALGLHANVPWTFGPLRYVLASPAFHRWHHTAEERGARQELRRHFPGVGPGVRHLLPARGPAAGGLRRERRGARRVRRAARVALSTAVAFEGAVGGGDYFAHPAGALSWICTGRSRRRRLSTTSPHRAGAGHGGHETTATAAQAWFVERLLAGLSARLGGEVAFSLTVLERPPLRFGEGAPRFSLALRTPRAVRAAMFLDEGAIGEAYLDGEESTSRDPSSRPSGCAAASATSGTSFGSGRPTPSRSSSARSGWTRPRSGSTTTRIRRFTWPSSTRAGTATRTGTSPPTTSRWRTPSSASSAPRSPPSEPSPAIACSTSAAAGGPSRSSRGRGACASPR